MTNCGGPGGSFKAATFLPLQLILSGPRKDGIVFKVSIPLILIGLIGATNPPLTANCLALTVPPHRASQATRPARTS